MFDETKLKKRKKVTSGAAVKVATKKNKPINKSYWLWILLMSVIAVIVILICVNKCKNCEPTTHSETKLIVDTCVVVGSESEFPTIGNESVVGSESEFPTIDNESVVGSESVQDSIDNGVITSSESNLASSTIQNVADNVYHDNKENVDILLMAKKVIRGDYGNGNERKVALGINYQVIQDQVNCNYRNGDLYW